MYARLFSGRFRRGFCCGLLAFALGLRLLLSPLTPPLLRRLGAKLGSRRILSICLLPSDLRLERGSASAPGSGVAAEASAACSPEGDTGSAPASDPNSVQFSDPAPAPSAADAQCAPTGAESIAPSAALHFTEADIAALELRGSCDYAVDPAALLQEPLGWQAAPDKPTVLVLHTHSCEAYTQEPNDPYEASAEFRTLDEAHNMLAVGDALCDELEARGITVLHDRSIHDYPSYNSSYADAKQQTEAFLAEYPSVVLVLDLHRDALDVPVREAVTLNGQDVARLMLVVGTDEGGLYHPFWPENLSCALKLQALLNRSCPGLMRPLNLRSERFNGQTSPGAMIVEVGSTGNTLAEAKRTMPYLADAIEQLLRAQAA